MSTDVFCGSMGNPVGEIRPHRHAMLLNNFVNGEWLLLAGSLLYTIAIHAQGVSPLPLVAGMPREMTLSVTNPVVAGTRNVSLDCTPPIDYVGLHTDRDITVRYAWSARNQSREVSLAPTSEISFPTEGRLVFPVVLLKHRGTYICRILYTSSYPDEHFETPMTEYHLSVVEEETLEIIGIGQYPQSPVAVGSAVVFQCVTRTGYEEVRWYVNGAPIQEDNHTYSTSEGGFLLQISNITAQLQGAVVKCQIRSPTSHRTAEMDCRPIHIITQRPMTTTLATPTTSAQTPAALTPRHTEQEAYNATTLPHSPSAIPATNSSAMPATAYTVRSASFKETSAANQMKPSPEVPRRVTLQPASTTLHATPATGTDVLLAEITMHINASCITDYWKVVLASKLNRTIRKHPAHCQLLLAGRFSIHSLTKGDRDCSNRQDQWTHNTLWKVIVNLSLESASQMAERRIAAECMRHQVRVLQYRATVEQVCYSTKPKECTQLTERTTTSLGSSAMPSTTTITGIQTSPENRSPQTIFTPQPTSGKTTFVAVLRTASTAAISTSRTPIHDITSLEPTSRAPVDAITSRIVFVFPWVTADFNTKSGINDANGGKSSTPDTNIYVLSVAGVGAGVVIICSVIIVISVVCRRRASRTSSQNYATVPVQIVATPLSSPSAESTATLGLQTST